MSAIDPGPAYSEVCIRSGNLHSPLDQQAVLELLNLYASRLPGRRRELSADVAEQLIPALRSRSGSHLFLAETTKRAETSKRIVGLALCFDGFSTFRASPLLNLHDLTVHPQFQRQGIGDKLLLAVIHFARQANYCAVTLEVMADNPARRLYARHGFESLQGECAGHLTLFGKLELC